jgi:protein-disulfide isomerase
LIGEVRRTNEEAPELGFTGTPSFAVEGRDGRLQPLGVIGSADELEAAIDSAR